MARHPAASTNRPIDRETLISLCVTATVTALFAYGSAILGVMFGMSLADAILWISLPIATMMTTTLLAVPGAGAPARDRLVDTAGCASTLAAICLAAGMSDALRNETGLSLTFAILGGGIACSFLMGLLMRKEGPALPMTFLSIQVMQFFFFSLAL